MLSGPFLSFPWATRQTFSSVGETCRYCSWEPWCLWASPSLGQYEHHSHAVKQVLGDFRGGKSFSTEDHGLGPQLASFLHYQRSTCNIELGYVFIFNASPLSWRVEQLIQQTMKSLPMLSRLLFTSNFGFAGELESLNSISVLYSETAVSEVMESCAQHISI